jgi:alkylation response protein AidB-like acyl-CoA dehydrogenase
MTQRNFQDDVRQLSPVLRERAARYDAEDCFVSENYPELKRRQLFSMLVPADLGGGGATLEEVCQVVRGIAQQCASTALSFSMHQHLVAATVLRHKRGQPGAKLLEKVAESERVLVSTGATDWVNSNGSAKPVEGGYRVSGRKVFGSGSPAGDILITSFAADEEPDGPSVIHCPVPLNAAGVTRLDDWHTLGMRGTGSHTLELKDVFVPAENVAVKRLKNQWHPAWDVALGIAPPLYMAAYVGLAEAASEVALSRASLKPNAVSTQLAVGQMETALTTAQLAWQDMVARAGNCDFTPSPEHANAQLVRKTIVTRAVQETVARAVEVAGGAGYYRNLPLERMWRDVQASHYHPLPEKRQQLFTGRHRLGQKDFWDV